ncbi:MAG: Cell division protein FtsH [Nitrospira sp.]|nr:MAG: Cell division protein FtsH [Nitrospira sp.]
MGWITAIVTGLVLWSGTAWGATLTWNASNGPDLAGYRVYKCSQLPCSQSADTAMLLSTLGTTTSFNIGTPAVVQYYVVTAYNSANIESSASNVATYTPAGTSLSSPPAGSSTPAPTVTLTILGSPTSGQSWTVQAYPANVAGTVSVEYWINNTLDHMENAAPYCPFDGADDGTHCVTRLRPFGFYTIEARVRSNGTEVARQAIMVQASATPPATSAPKVTLSVLGSPTSGQPWTVQAYPANVAGTVSVQFLINNTVNRIEAFAPYCPFDGADDGAHCLTKLKPFGFYTLEARVLSNGTEVTRQVIVVKASSQ